jgi:DNA polymerase sigma
MASLTSYEDFIEVHLDRNRQQKFMEICALLPGFDLKLFGSQGLNLCLKDSDLDVYVASALPESESVSNVPEVNEGVELPKLHLASLLKGAGMQRVKIVDAKVPLVKCSYGSGEMLSMLILRLLQTTAL